MGTSLAKVKKGDTVMLCMFTGLRAGPKEVIACDSKTITIDRKKKGEAVFDRKTGKLIKPKPDNDRYASYIEEDDGTFVHPMHKDKKSKSKKAAKKATKKAKPEPEVEEEEIEEEEVEETPAPKKKSTKAATKKKPAPKKKPEPEPEEDDEDEDEDDDFDDDDFEEVE